MKRILLVLGIMVASSWPAGAKAPEEHEARAIVIEVEPEHRMMEVSCDEIPGYMSAMEMSFAVRDAKKLADLKPGMAIAFTIVSRGKTVYAEKIQTTGTASFESEPMEAGSLTALNSILRPTSAHKELEVGETVPDFSLTDQAGKQVQLSQFRGKVVALTFGYSRCPNPNYCYRLSNNLEHLEHRFRHDAGKELVLLTIAIDPEHDRGAALADYANRFHADVADWHFLSGSLADVKQTASLFGMNFWNSEGVLTHSLHTVVLDRQGRIAANLEGNQFTANQLGDLVQAELNRR